MTGIFESPDKGETIYVRQSGSTNRTLHSMSERKFNLHERIMEDQLWGNIRRAAETNKTLADILDQAKMVYALIKKENN